MSHRSALDKERERTKEWSSVVNIVYNEDSGNATPSVNDYDNELKKYCSCNDNILSLHGGFI